MSAQPTAMQEWLHAASIEQLREGAIWLQVDSRGLYEAADRYRSTGQDWLAAKVQENAAYSAAAARAAAGAAS